jgi:peptidoglycan-associated lipoprotein
MLRNSWKRVALVLLMGVGAALPAAAQWISRPASVDLGVNYVADIANARPGTCGCFTMQGGGVNARLGMAHHLAAVADLSVVNTNSVSGANYGLGLMTMMAGPQYRFRAGRYKPYGQVLLGAVHGFNSVFPVNAGNSAAGSSNSATGFVFALGAGSEVQMGPKFSARLIELDYLHTNLPNNSNNWQNHLKIAAGLIYHF